MEAEPTASDIEAEAAKSMALMKQVAETHPVAVFGKDRIDWLSNRVAGDLRFYGVLDAEARRDLRQALLNDLAKFFDWADEQFPVTPPTKPSIEKQ